MLRGLYTAATGMMSAGYNEEVISNNLANLKTPGFKKAEVAQSSFATVLLGQLEKTSPYSGYWQYLGTMPFGSGVAEIAIDYSQGVLRATSLATDFALEGEGFFTLQLPDGERGYTRNGSFVLDRDGYLVTDKGYFVLGEKGPIQLEGDNFEVDSKGNIQQNGVLTDRLLLTLFANNDFEQIRDGIFQPRGGNAPQGGNNFRGKVNQGYLEEPNIDLSAEMAKMITNLRFFEANQRVVGTYDQLLRVSANEIGRLV